MKSKIFKIMAVVLTAIFIISSISVIAAPSKEKVNKDYRNMEILNKQGLKVNKPTAQFAANRIVNGEIADMAISYTGYDCNMQFPTLVCYVGDTLTFTDMSRDNNGGKIVEWDWQRFGALGDNFDVYNRNIVNEDTYTLTEAGETIFYLCVKSDIDVKYGCCDPWSENGNHQVVGKNKWYPDGAYWYFTAIRVIVKPVKEAVLNVRYWDIQNNKIFHTEKINADKLFGSKETTDVSVHIQDMPGYKYSSWNVQLMDGTIQYNGIDRDVKITLAQWLSEKYLNIEYIPVNDKKVTVNYINSNTDEIIKTKVISPQKDTTEIEFENIEGFVIEDWELKTPDGVTEKTGTELPVIVTLTDKKPHKILNVNCFPLKDDKVDNPKPSPTVTVKPSGVCNGIIEWTETDSHRVIIGYTKNGNPIYSWCNHTFKYKAVLGATANISPTTLKSGYGFGVDVDYRLNTTMVSNSGCKNWGDNRKPSATIKNPTTATVFVPWNMTNRLGSQGKSISMVSNGPLKFTLPSSSISEIGAKKIYTPVELAGTKESPQSHSFEIYIGGGGVDSIEFCKKLTGTITINGDMYEDDFSGAD